MIPVGHFVTMTRRPGDGVMLEVAEAGPADGPLIIFLHGFPDFWWGWQQQIPAFVDAGYRLLLPNQRGYGTSDKPAGVSAYDLDQLANDVFALADSVNASTFDLVGHDWGGIIAWWAAARRPSRVRQLATLNAPHPGAFWRYLRRHPTQMLKSWYAAFFQLPWLPESVLRAANYEALFRGVQRIGRPGLFDERDREAFVAGWSQPGALTAMLNYYRAFGRRSVNSLELRVLTPTLILHGRRDPAEEPGLAQASLRYSHDGRIVWLDEAAHWIQREEPQAVNAAILRFFTSQ